MLLGTLGRQSGQLDKAVTSLSELVHGLAERRTDISNAVAYTNAATKTIADLLNQAQEPVKKVVNETSRVSDVVLADRDYVDNLLNTLPDKYQMLGRQGIYGDYFSFYFCDIVLKLNGKGRPTGVRQGGRPGHRAVHTQMRLKKAFRAQSGAARRHRNRGDTGPGGCRAR